MDGSPHCEIFERPDHDLQGNGSTAFESPANTTRPIYTQGRARRLEHTPGIGNLNLRTMFGRFPDPRLEASTPPNPPPPLDSLQTHVRPFVEDESMHTVNCNPNDQTPLVENIITNNKELGIREGSLNTAYLPDPPSQPVPDAAPFFGLSKPPISGPDLPPFIQHVQTSLMSDEQLPQPTYSDVVATISTQSSSEQESPTNGQNYTVSIRQSSNPTSRDGPSLIPLKSLDADQESAILTLNGSEPLIAVERPHRSFSHAITSLGSFGDSTRSPKPITLPQKTPQQISRQEMTSQNEWQRIKQLRIDIWSLRSNLHELRRLLREKQTIKAATQNKFLQYIREHSYEVDHDPTNLFRVQNTMARLLKDCEDAAEEYGPIEDECTELENQLGRQEFKLQRLEEKFYERRVEPALESRHSEVEDSEQLSNSSSSSYGGSETALQFHPLVAQYLSKVGDVEILRERLDWHVEERDLLEEEKETRARVKLALAEEDQEWLDNFSDVEGELIAEFEEAETEAEKLRQGCLAQGLVDKDGNITDFQTLEGKHFLRDNLNDGRKSSEYSRFSRLIPPPGSKRFKVHESGFGENVISSHEDHDRVDLWLLHQLRISPMNVNLLVRIAEANLGQIDVDTWQVDVLDFWHNDGPKRKMPTYSYASSGVVTQAPRKSLNLDSSTSDKIEPDIYHPTLISAERIGGHKTDPIETQMP